MIYVPGQFLFIHIPRAAGMSITETIIKNSTMFNTIMVAVGSEPKPFWRHSRCEDLRGVIPDYSDIWKFAIYRDDEEIIESDYKLKKRCGTLLNLLEMERDFRLSVIGCRAKSLDEHRLDWEYNMEGLSIWDFFCDDSVERFEFSKLQESWEEIGPRVGCKDVPLVHVNSSEIRYIKSGVPGKYT
jgi:hypothetical protein